MKQAADEMDGAQSLIKTLESLDVEYIFGYSGGAAIPIFDAIETTNTPIKLILTRHEQGATHMADGYARASGKPGIVLVTSGPGAGNTVTGLMTAQMDNVPIIVISGQQIRPMLGLDAFQEADTFNITMPVVKHNYLVMDTNDIPRITKEAFHIATSGRPGPVLIDLPKDVSSGVFTSDNLELPELPAYSSEKPSINRSTIKKVATALAIAKKPVLLAGHGVLISGATEELEQFVEDQSIPVTTTLLGKGAFDEAHPLSLGMLGMHGTAYANKAICEADLILNIGSRFDDRIIGKATEFGKNATIVHVDIDDAEFNKMIKTDICIHADAKEFLEVITSELPATRRKVWAKHVSNLKHNFPIKAVHDEGLSQQEILAELNDKLNSDAIVTTDVGQHQMWAAQFLHSHEANTWISSGGAGTMGFGLPSGIGAQFAAPNTQVAVIAGDGGFQMTLFELATAAIHKLPIKIFVLNNHYLGMVRQWQELFFDNRTSGVDLVGNPDFVALAQSYGIKGLNIRKREEIESVIAEALDYNDGPVLINCEVEKTHNVYPMVPAGSALEGMLIEAPTEQLEKPTGST